MDQAETLVKIMKQNNNSDAGKNPAFNREKKGTKIFAIASGKGGVGKTNVSINLAIAFARMGKEVVVMDGDLGLANVNVILGIVPKYNLYNVLKGQKKLKDIIIDTPEGIKIIAGASGFHQLANMENEKKHFFMEELAQLSFADIIIIDTGAGVHDNVLSFVLAADEVLIVTTPEPTSITDAYGIIKTIAAHGHNIKISLIVNRVSDLIEGKKVADRVIKIANQFLNVKVENLGFIYEDQAVGLSVLKQKPFIVYKPKSKAAACIEHLSLKLEKIEPPEDEGGFKKFLKTFFSLYKEK